MRSAPSTTSPARAAAAPAPRHLAFLLPNLKGRGVQRVVTVLSAALLARGHRVDIVTCEARGELLEAVREGVRIVPLPASSRLAAAAAAFRADPGGFRLLLPFFLGRKLRISRTAPHLPALAEYLRSERPATLFSADIHQNVEAVLARRLAGVPLRIVLSERNHFSSGKPIKRWRARRLAPAMRRAYLEADAVTAVSAGVADDLAASLDIPRARIRVLHNPTIGPDFAERMAAPVDHPWFLDKPAPLVVGVGHLGYQKDFETLLRAFARARRRRPMRLAIVGGAKKPAPFLELAERLGVREEVALLGYRANPVAYVARADLFVLSSRYEGFPNVLLEALACGTPVVATDCPHGPREILDGGRYGRLVPVADEERLAEAMLETLDSPPDPAYLRSRAGVFGYDAAIDAYERILLGDPEPE